MNAGIERAARELTRSIRDLIRAEDKRESAGDNEFYISEADREIDHLSHQVAVDLKDAVKAIVEDINKCA